MARVERLTLTPHVYGRWVPSVPVHPAHLVLSVLDADSGCWSIVQEVDLPYDPRIAGEGLSPTSSIEEMEDHFEAILRGQPQEIQLDGFVTDHLRVECDREHPVWPSHGEVNGERHQVPFGILDTLVAWGRIVEPREPGGMSSPPLTVAEIAPAGDAGLQVEADDFEVRYTSENLSVGFSTRRPLVKHLGWDAPGEHAGRNRIMNRIGWTALSQLGGVGGPLLRTISGDVGGHQCTGVVRIVGNRVSYSDIELEPGLVLNVDFLVEPDRLSLRVEQNARRPIQAIEYEAWRFGFDATVGNTAAAAMPSSRAGRAGDVCLPFQWSTDGSGCLTTRFAGRDTCDFQVESFRSNLCVTGGPVLAERSDEGLRIPAGRRKVEIEFRVDELLPVNSGPEEVLSQGVRRHWASTFACFRPEYRGFSNNSVSVNCHMSQLAPVDVAAATKPPAIGPDPVDLARYTVEIALLDGGGYGYWRNLYLDSDPSLVSAAGRLHQVRPDPSWLKRIEPGLRTATSRMLSNVGSDGLLVCSDLSGNTGSHRWSSNAMDVVGFGNIDAFVNALTYRGLRNAVALFRDLGDTAHADALDRAARGIRSNYARVLVNPDTGWVAGWRSRDGRLHDYAFPHITAMAACFGLLEPEAGRLALERLESLREETGCPSAHFGIPLNLLPIEPGDHMLPSIFSALQPTFGVYTDGSLSGYGLLYYLRALSAAGLTDRAERVAAEAERGFAASAFTGGVGSGSEFRTWDGMPTGYEGTLIGCVSGVYAIAVQQGYVRPTKPEWWPANG
jgi:hypothetical protein